LERESAGDHPKNVSGDSLRAALSKQRVFCLSGLALFVFGSFGTSKEPLSSGNVFESV
jgi:hypothetical protein